MTYDDRQAAAVLIVCATCGKAAYMVSPQAVCIKCRPVALVDAVAAVE